MSIRSPKRNTATAAHLDLIRASAAFAVFSDHLRTLFFADLARVSHPGILLPVLYWCASLGHQSVMVFFVLSGFFISSSVARAIDRGQMDWRAYASSRLSRLYAALVPALVLCAILDFVGLALSHGKGVYGSGAWGGPAYHGMVPHPISSLYSVRNWLGSLFFLQGIRSAPFGSDGPLWSLSYEFWYYVVFPCGVMTVLAGTTRKRSICGALAIAAMAFAGTRIAIYGLVWVMGVGVCLAVPKPQFGSRRAIAAAAGVFLLSLVNSTHPWMHSTTVRDMFIGLTFACLLYCLLSRTTAPAPAVYARFTGAASGISYSFYLLHVPALFILNWLLLGRGAQWRPNALHLAAAGAITVTVVMYTVLVWRFTEARTDCLRSWMLRRLVPERVSADVPV